MSAHRIHLKGPWEYEWLGPAGGVAPRGASPTGAAQPPEAPTAALADLPALLRDAGLAPGGQASGFRRQASESKDSGLRTRDSGRPFALADEPPVAPDGAGLSTPISGRVKMPCEWRSIFGAQTGRARFARRFHQPTGLEPGDVVRLVFDGLGGAATFRLNDELLVPPLDRASASTPEPQSLAFEVTSLLRAANRLVVEIEFDPGAAPAERGGLFGPVAIDICTQ